MRELITLVKLETKISKNTIYVENYRNFIGILIGIFFILVAPVCLGIIMLFKRLTQVNLENIIFNTILNIDVLISVVVIFLGVLNNFFLENNLKEICIYPIKEKVIFASKIIFEYIKGLLIQTLFIAPFTVYGLINSFSIEYYFKITLFMVGIPLIILSFILNILLLIIGILKFNKKIVLEKIMFILMQIVNGGFILNFIMTKDKYEIFNLLSNRFYNGMELSFIETFVIIANLCVLVLLMDKIYFNIAFKKKNKRISENSNIEIKVNKKVVSLIKREIKEILRTPIIIWSIISITGIYFLLFIGFMSFIKNNMRDELFLLFVVLVMTITMVSTNIGANFAYSREVKNLKHLEVLPITAKDIFLSKLIVGIILNSGMVISINIGLLMIGISLFGVIVINIATIGSMIFMTFLNIVKDSVIDKKRAIRLIDLFNDLDLILKGVLQGALVTIFYIITFLILNFTNMDSAIKLIVFMLASQGINLVFCIKYLKK